MLRNSAKMGLLFERLNRIFAEFNVMSSENRFTILSKLILLLPIYRLGR
jgi:hypothetical protein